MGTSHRELLMLEVRVGRRDRTAARRKCLNPVSGEKRDIQPDKEGLEGRRGEETAYTRLVGMMSNVGGVASEKTRKL